MVEAGWERVGWGAGIGFAVLSVVGAGMGGSPPPTTDSAAKVAQYFVDGGAGLRWGSFVALLSFVLLAWWGASAARMLHRTTGSVRLTVAVALGIAFAAIGAAANLALVSAISLAGVTGAGGVNGVRFFYLVSTCFLGVTFMGFSLIAYSMASAVLRLRVMPRIVGILALLVALLNIIGSAIMATTDDTIFSLSFACVISVVLFVVVVSIVMLVRPVPESDAAAEVR